MPNLLIAPVSPKAAQLGIHLYKATSVTNATLRDLLKDTPLLKGSRKRKKDGEKAQRLEN